MVTYIKHLGSQDACGTVKGGEGLIELCHVSTDGWFAFHHVHRLATVGDFQSCLDPRDASTDNQHFRINGYKEGVEWLLMENPPNSCSDKSLCFLGGFPLI